MLLWKLVPSYAPLAHKARKLNAVLGAVSQYTSSFRSPIVVCRVTDIICDSSRRIDPIILIAYIARENPPGFALIEAKSVSGSSSIRVLVIDDAVRS